MVAIQPNTPNASAVAPPSMTKTSAQAIQWLADTPTALTTLSFRFAPHLSYAAAPSFQWFRTLCGLIDYVQMLTLKEVFTLENLSILSWDKLTLTNGFLMISKGKDYA